MSTPIVQAILVADHVYKDKGSDKHVVCGIFREVYFTAKDASQAGESEQQGGEDSGQEARPKNIHDFRRMGSPYAYISMTELYGSKDFDLHYVDLTNSNVLFSLKFKLECGDPLATLELSIALPGLPVPHAGSYALELLCENEIIGSHRIRAFPNPYTTRPES